MDHIDMNDKTSPAMIQVPYLSGALVNALIVGVIVWAWAIIKYDPTIYYLTNQEDQIIEWMSFWLFFISGILFFLAAHRQHAAMSKIPWFLIGTGLFCIFVAMEEISWGQRLFSYRPPAYFLEQNFQQEFNFHNVMEKSLRKLALKATIIGYGIVLPMAWLVPAIRQLGWKIGIVPPPVYFSPAFLAAYCFYEVYPWKFSGELVELMLGLGFVFSAMAINFFFKKTAASTLVYSVSIVVLIAIITGLGAGTTYINARMHQQPELIEMAKKEVMALGYDMRKTISLSPDKFPRRNLNIRLYTFVKRYKIDSKNFENFRGLTKKGLPEERAQFFIDPWNTPYWIRLSWDLETNKVKIGIYSFGPNRSRDSHSMEISEDDIGVYVHSTF